MDTPTMHETAPSPWMTTEEAAAYRRLAPGTLKNWRVAGSGPKHRAIGRAIRYHVDDLDAFMMREAS